MGFKFCYDFSSGVGCHFTFYVDGDIVYVLVKGRDNGDKAAFSAAEFDVERGLVFKGGFPFSFDFFGGFYAEITCIKFGASPWFSSDSQVLSGLSKL